MSGHVAAIFRHPVKGFTPERLTQVDLAPGQGFPHDRTYAVENGPSGFDPDAPAWVSKQKFTVQAAIPKVAAARTRYDDATGVLHAEVKPIVRCVATHVDPTTGMRDLDVVKALFDNYGHAHCGIYVQVTRAGRVGVGDALGTPSAAGAAAE